MKRESELLNENKPKSWMTRRKFLAIGGVTGCGLIAMYVSSKYANSNTKDKNKGGIGSTEPVEIPEVQEVQVAETYKPISYSTKPVKGIPRVWVEKKGTDVLRYANFIQDLGLKNISAYDVLYPHFKTRGRTSNALPPRRLWPNIVPTLRVIDRIATELNAKVKPFVSVYISPAYNRATRGRSKSQRLLNKASWIQFYGVDTKVVAATARRLRAQGLFKGGVGRYRSFVHIDTRGHNADW